MAAMKCLNGFGMAYCVVVLSIIMLTSLGTTMPYVYKPYPEMLFTRQLIAYFLCANIVFNYLLTMFYNSYYEPSKMQHSGLVDSNWGKCLDCDQLIPPRAHHCTLCRGCILKRDHHCFFTGCCVGFYNQRYFIGFLFHVMIGCSYALYLLVSYVDSEYAVFHQTTSWYQFLYHFFLPVALGEFLMGYLDVVELVFILIGYLMFASGMGATVAFVIEMYLVCRGMTAYEIKKDGPDFSRKPRLSDNLRGVFGNYWIVNFLVPLPWIKPKGNGIDWYSRAKAI